MISSATKFFENELFVQVHTPIVTSSDCEGAGEVFNVSPQNSAGGAEEDAKHTQSACEYPHGSAVSSPTPLVRAAVHANQSRGPSESSSSATENFRPGPDVFGNGFHQSDEQFFRSPKYLTVSAQLHLEALAQSVERVWTLSPTFRAERSDTPRHLSEFYMLEAELSFIDNIQDVMDLVERLIKALTSGLLASPLSKELLAALKGPQESCEGEVTVSDLSRRWQDILARKWPRLTYHQAVLHLRDAMGKGRAKFETEVDDVSGLQTEHEKFLAIEVGCGAPVFVTDYPKVIKPFYMAPSQGNAVSLGTQQTVACFDLLMPDLCEVVGGSLREHRLERLQQNMRELSLFSERGESLAHKEADQGLDWYIDLRRYGSLPHGGFGMGFDRLLGYLAGISNLRDTATFPRWHGRCTC